MTAPKLELMVSADVKLLLGAAADGFLQPLSATPDDPFPTPQYLLALRQGALRDDVIRLAARKGCKGWFYPPLCIFHELPLWLGQPAAAPLGDVERLALLGSIVRGVGGEVFGRLRRLDYYLESLDRFIGELISEGTTAEEFKTATAAAAAGVQGSFPKRKQSELASIYADYLEALDREGVRDGRDELASIARLVAKDPEALSERLGGRREIRLYGLSDLRGGWRRLLTSLVDSSATDRVRIYVTHQYTSSELHDLPPAAVTYLEKRDNVWARSIFGTKEPNGNSRPRGSFSIIEAPNTEREMGEVAKRVRRLVDAGTPPHRVSIVARSGRPHVDLAVRALKVFGVPATARLRTSCSEIPVIKAVASLLAAASDGWTRQRLVDLARSPFFGPLFDSDVFDFLGFRRAIRGLSAWRAAIYELSRQPDGPLESEDKVGSGSVRRPTSACAAKTLEEFDAFRGHAGDLDRRQTLYDWVAWLEDFMQRDPFDFEAKIYDAPEGEYASVKRDLAGWHALNGLISEWKSAVARWGDAGVTDPVRNTAISVSEFSKRFRDLLDGQIGVWTESPRGVQVMEALAASHRGFDYVFLVGMEAGSFPHPASRSPILDDDERSRLRNAGIHLDTRADWDLRERELFRSVVGGAGQLTISYPKINLRGAETIRSSFIEALIEVADATTVPVDEYAAITPDTPLAPTTAARDQAFHGAQIEYDRVRGVESPFSGIIIDRGLLSHLSERFDDNKLWSPSQIETYAKCPWAYFSIRLLRLQKLEEPDEEMEATVRGSLLHDALARFYDRAGDERGRPVFLRSSDLEWAESLMNDVLDTAFDDMEQLTWLGHPTLRPFKRSELKRDLLRYLAWEVEHHDRMEDVRKSDAAILRTGADYHELRFGEDGDVVLERHGVVFRYRGIIDRVDRGVDARIEDASRFVAAIDYKSSIRGVPGEGRSVAWDEGVVLQVPLYAHALTQLTDHAEVSRVEYRPLGETKPGASPGKARAHCLQLYGVDKKTGDLVRNENDMAKMDNALNMVCKHVSSVRKGRFPVRPAPSCGCPAYCPAYDVCRVPPHVREAGT